METSSYCFLCHQSHYHSRFHHYHSLLHFHSHVLPQVDNHRLHLKIRRKLIMITCCFSMITCGFPWLLTVTSILSRLLLDKATYYSRYEFQSKMWSEKYTFWHSTAGSPMGSTKVFPECIAWCYMYIIDFLREKFDYSSNRRGVNTVKKKR